MSFYFPLLVVPAIPRPLNFMRMPTEIRVRIYGNVFNEAVLNIVDGNVDNANSTGPLAICLTNRTIYNESILDLYRSTKLVYVQVLRSVGPNDIQIAPAYRSLIRTLVLRRSRHFTQFKINWNLLQGFRNLQLLRIEDDSVFIFSTAADDDDLHTDVTELSTPNGPVDDLVIRIMGESTHVPQVQPRPIVNSVSFDALVDRINATPARRFRIEYWKTGILTDRYGGHVFMVILSR